MANLQTLIEGYKEQITFSDPAVEAVVEAAFIAGGKAQAALLTIDSANTSDPKQDLGDYTDGIYQITKTVGLLKDLSETQRAAYKASLNKVIVNTVPEVEAALESFADSNLDMTAAIEVLNVRMNELISAAQEGS